MPRTLLGRGPVVGALGVTTLMALGVPARAATPAPAAPPSPSTVESVIVTARRVAERLQDVPAAVTAVTARQIEELKPRTIQDLSGMAPNVQIGMVGAGAGASAIYIRGLGYSDIEKGQNPAVGLMIDDVVIGTNTAQLIDSFDVDQIEIGRGPQGIFYGKNTTAGVINIHRTRPTHAWGLNASVAGGDYGQNIERFIANAPLGDFGLKFGFSHRARQGFLHNIYTHNNHYGKDELNTGIVQLDWKPTSDFDALLTADFVNQTGEGTPVTLGDPAAAQVLGPVLAPFGIQFNQYGSPYIPGVTVPLNPREAANDYPDRNRLVQQRYSANLTWDSPIGQFVSITAFIKQYDDAEQDFDGSCGVSELGGTPCPVLANPLLPFLHTSRPQQYRQFTEEARFTHNFGDKVRLLAGVFYYHHKISAVQFTRTAVPGVPVTAPFTRQDSGESNDSTSVFANVDYNVTSRLQISGGVRYIHESKDFHNGFNLLYIPGVGPADVTLLPAFTRSKSWNKTITRVSVDYKLTDNNLLYASRSDGFRSGGFSPRSTLSESIPGQTNYSPGADYSGFNPETDTAYEIGSKNTFLDGAVTLNVAAFYTNDRDHQASEVVVTPGYGPGTNTYIVNLPKVEIKGFEVEAAWRPTTVPGLTLTALYGYQDAKIKNGKVPGVEGPLNPDGSAGAPGSVLDLTGQPLERVPKSSYTLRGDYTWPIGEGTADANVGYRWTAHYNFATFGTVPDVQASYGLLDASVSYAWRNYKLTLSGKNLTNKLYRSNSLPPVLFQGWAEPRTWLLELAAKW